MMKLLLGVSLVALAAVQQIVARKFHPKYEQLGVCIGTMLHLHSDQLVACKC